METAPCFGRFNKELRFNVEQLNSKYELQLRKAATAANKLDQLEDELQLRNLGMILSVRFRATVLGWPAVDDRHWSRGASATAE